MAPPRRPPQRSSRRAGRRRLALLVSVVVLVTVALITFSGITSSANGGASNRSGTNGTPLDPEAFATGSCIAYPPTSGDRGQTVFLDAGHGGIDPGAVGTTESGATVEEAIETLPVELDAMAILRADGFRVVVSRTTASTVTRLSAADVTDNTLTFAGAHDDVAARDQCANDAKAQALVGIYYDAGATTQNAGSIAAYDPDRPFAAKNLRLATLMQNDVLADMNAQGWAIPNDGVQTDEQLGSLDGDPSDGGLAEQAAAYNHLLLLGPAAPGYFSTPSTMPGTVIEPLYITDPFEGSIAASAKGQSVIAQGVATAVEQFLAPPHKHS